MAPVKNGRLIFNEYPTGYPIPGKTTVYDDSKTIDLDHVPLNGGFLIKVLNIALDPYLRGMMKEVSDFNAQFTIGEPLFNHGVAVVLRSEFPGVKPGDHVVGFVKFQNYDIHSNLEGLHIIKNEENIPWSAYLGAAGMPGRTAWFGWKEYAKYKEGETVFVTAAASLVGSIVVQLAKAAGLKVIASAGSESKVEYVKSLGADVVFNYKTVKTSEVLKQEGPINVYWDNVGGEVLDAAIANAAQKAHFIICGQISGYNTAPQPVYNMATVLWREITLTGFLVASLNDKYWEPFYKEVPKLIANGTIKYTEEITVGLENAGHALEAVQKGTNNGKAIVIVSEHD